MSMARFDEPAARPLWLITLADLSLLLLGFFVLLQASRATDPGEMAEGIRRAFGGPAEQHAVVETAMPVDLAASAPFAPASAALPTGSEAVADWVRDATRDPRTVVTLTGSSAGARDVDPATGSAAVLAIDRARALAALLVAKGAIDPQRIRIAAAARGPDRTVTLSIGFAGASSDLQLNGAR